LDLKWNKSVYLVDGNTVERLDDLDASLLDNDMYIAATCYVIEAKEFDYSKGTKRALKLTVSCDNYISEKVLWPDFNTGKLDYPQEVKKGSICTLLMRKKVNKNGDMNITQIIVESC